MEQLQERKNLFVGHIDVPAPPTLADGPCLQSAGCKNVAPVLNRVGDKWSMLIVMILSSGSRRFSELKREIDGISQRMLTLSLRGLERDGLVTRTVTPSIPPRVDYELTELGISLREPVKALGDWAIEHIGCIRAAQERYDAAADAL
ncbi:MAG: helix-turn-helix domain-containing protein [Sphingomicrobium sp.]